MDETETRRPGGAPRRFDVRVEAGRTAPDPAPRTTIRRLRLPITRTRTP